MQADDYGARGSFSKGAKNFSPAAWLATRGDWAATDSMERSRKVVGLSLIAAAAMGLIAAYQTEIIKHLPEPPLPLLDADKVDASSSGVLQVVDAGRNPGPR